MQHAPLPAQKQPQQARGPPADLHPAQGQALQKLYMMVYPGQAPRLIRDPGKHDDPLPWQCMEGGRRICSRIKRAQGAAVTSPRP